MFVFICFYMLYYVSICFYMLLYVFYVFLCFYMFLYVFLCSLFAFYLFLYAFLTTPSLPITLPVLPRHASSATPRVPCGNFPLRVLIRDQVAVQHRGIQEIRGRDENGLDRPAAMGLQDASLQEKRESGR
jgi:hypothetical protein